MRLAEWVRVTQPIKQLSHSKYQDGNGNDARADADADVGKAH